MKKLLSISALSALVIGAFMGGNAHENTRLPVKGKKTAYIINMTESDVFHKLLKVLYCDRGKLGITCDTFSRTATA